MSKKDKKIEIQIVDSKVIVGKDTFDGFTLSIGKKTIGEIADMAGQFAIIKNGKLIASGNTGDVKGDESLEAFFMEVQNNE